MKVRTLVARHPGGAITPENDWRLYAENAVAPLRRKSGGAITPKTKWRLYAGNS
ncbi:nitrogen fixation protein, partial [Caballeronia udeis]